MIIGAFTGVGKTYLSKNKEKYKETILDLDSNPFKWEGTVEGSTEWKKGSHGRNRINDWEKNYIEEIKRVYDEYDIILVVIGNQKENEVDIALELKSQGYEVIGYLPRKEQIEEFMERCRTRGNTEEVVNNIKTRFEKGWRHLLSIENTPYKEIKEDTLEDELIKNKIINMRGL